MVFESQVVLTFKENGEWMLFDKEYFIFPLYLGGHWALYVLGHPQRLKRPKKKG